MQERPSYHCKRLVRLLVDTGKYFNYFFLENVILFICLPFKFCRLLFLRISVVSLNLMEPACTGGTGIESIWLNPRLRC